MELLIALRHSECIRPSASRKARNFNKPRPSMPYPVLKAFLAALPLTNHLSLIPTLSSFPYSSEGSENACLISSGDQSRLMARRITALTVSLRPGRLNPFFPLLAASFSSSV